MPDEKKPDAIKELESKNVAYYSVVLQTVIQSEIDAVKTSVTLSSVAIGLLVTWDFSSKTCPLLVTSVQGLCFISFVASIISGVWFHLSSSNRYSEEIKNIPTDDGQKKLSQARASFKTKKLIALWSFVLGVIGFGTVGVLNLIERY